MPVITLSRSVCARSVYTIAGLAAALCAASPARATEFLVSNAAQITTAMNSAQPGDTLVMADGVWTDQHIDFAGAGTSTNPITLRAQTPGGVTLNGSSTLSISGNWLVADGLRFEGGALGAGEHVIRFKGSDGVANNSRLTNTAIINYNPASVDTRYFWVSLYGDNNRVDHNYFSGQNHQGVTVVDWLDGTTNFNRIDSNYFSRPAPINPADSNGFETIRIGTSDYSLSNANDTVENNVFERSDGEIEIISNKSGGNIYRYNTFRESSGTLTLRHGNNATVEGNFFLGENKNSSGGVRVIGEDHTIINNYFADLDGRAGGAISISAGVPSSPLSGYYQVKDALIAHNTIVNVQEAAITFDDGLGSSGRTLLAENVTVANNLIYSTADPLFEGNEGTGWAWEGNIAFGQSLGPKAGAAGITVVNPQLVLGSDGLWRPASSSPAINGGSGDYSGVLTTDMDGQARIGIYDVGADEFSAATIVRKPLEMTDVGPDWMFDDPDPTGGGCNGSGCAIQAEDFAFLLNPNGDSDTWILQDTPDALGGKSLRAPAGSIVNLPSGTHDAIAVYDLTFSQPGTYTAYYRARGFDGSSDSIYTPTDFNVDPNVIETLSSDGVYRWEVGQTFVIAPQHVGVPLEFRIAKREQFTDFDAFVLNLSGTLSAAQLDALFDAVALEGDLDGDGFVGIADLNIVLGNWNQNVTAGNLLAGDPTGDGFVGIGDLNLVLGNWNAGTPPDASANIPEPATLTVLLAAGCAMLRRRPGDEKF
jgi:poly(beta-D-mannuronate) lyase